MAGTNVHEIMHTFPLMHDHNIHQPLCNYYLTINVIVIEPTSSLYVVFL